MAENLLIVEDEETLRDSLKRVFQREGYQADAVDTAEAALEVMQHRPYDLILTDIMLPGIDGIEFLKRAREISPEQLIIVMTAFASIENAVDALRGGAYDYIIKPIIHEELKRIVKNAFRERTLRTENIILKKQLGSRCNFDQIIGQGQAISGIIEEVRKIADSKSNVLILGETGTGKELFARSIHYNSVRKDQPFIPINCSSIPEALLESELFGHVKGAFTGALHTKRGLFEEADGGTIFLDEIGDLSQPLQAKLLRVIDDREIRPLGATQGRKVDIRFVSATNKDISVAVKEGHFREDLFYRINVVTLKLPSLRDRKEDIPALIEHFLKKYSQEIAKDVSGVSPDVLGFLVGYSWPGNVRELQNMIERAVLISDGPQITLDNLPESIQPADKQGRQDNRDLLSIEEYTKQFILAHQHRYTEKQLSGLLGITRKSLWEKRKKWHLQRSTVKSS